MLDTQTDTSGAIRAWASNLATITGELREHDGAVRGLLERGPGAAEEVRALLDRLQPTLPIVLANLVNVNEVAITYQPALEQLLVLLPQGTATTAGHRYRQPEHQTGLQGRVPELQSEPEPAARLYDRPPPPSSSGSPPLEDYPIGRPAIRTAASRRTPRSTCAVPVTCRVRRCPASGAPERPAMCESDENYVPLNDGFNWKGDPNATISGQAIPQISARDTTCGKQCCAPAAAPLPVAAAEYDPASGTYVGPDGQVYTQSNLARTANEEQTWQTMLLPSPGK